VSVLDWIIAHTGDLAFGRLNSSQGSRMCFAPLTAGVCNVCHWFIKSDAFANATGEAAMGPDDRRSSIRRSGKDRRSGADTRSEREQRSVGERRSHKDRRSALDRRSNAAATDRRSHQILGFSWSLIYLLNFLLGYRLWLGKVCGGAD
jgi:hypothetical protein